MTAVETRPEISAKGVTPKGATPRSRPSSRRRNILLGLFAAVAIAAIAIATGGNKAAPPPAAAPVTAPPALSARGTVEPVAQANIATIGGGVIRSLGVKVGQVVETNQVVAQIGSQGQTELLVAPWRGTVMGLNANLGDTAMPGTVVATIGDLSRYQVRTTDVDEYLIGQISPGQQVSITVEALDSRKLQGAVDTVALAQQSTSAGAVSYPVVIQLVGNDRDLRPGMTVRIVFETIR